MRDQTGCFYIFISELAAHTQNLRHTPQTSMLFIRPESASNNLFARERATLTCAVTETPRASEPFSATLEQLQAKFGDVIGVLRSLNDFHLFKLSPSSGRFVLGFGQAYAIQVADDTLTHINTK